MQQSRNLISLCVYFFLFLTGCILLRPVLSGSASFCINPDNLHQAYPFFNKLAASLHKGYLPVWDANTYGGKNFSGEFQSGIFYPLNILFCLLFGNAEGIQVYYLDLLVVLHYFICLLGMFSLCRVLRFSHLASIASALVFTFTGILSSRSGGQTCIFFGLCLLPWAIYFVSKYYLVRRKRIFLVCAGLVSGLEILAGHLQPFFHTLLIAGVMILFFEYSTHKDRRSFIGPVALNLGIVLFFAILISLPQDYYGFQYLSQAYRWVGADSPIGPGEKVPLAIYAHKNIIRLSDLPNLLRADYAQPEDGNRIYMGILPLFLFLTCLFKSKAFPMSREHDQLKKLLLLILVIGILSTLGYLSFFYLILYEIPFVAAIRELGRYGVLLGFSAALLVGLTLTYVEFLKASLSGGPSAWLRSILLALSINTLYLVLFENAVIPRQVTIPFLLAFSFFLLLPYVKKIISIRLFAVAFIITDLCLNRVNYASTASAFYPSVFYKKNRLIDSLETTYGKYRVAFDIQTDDSLRRNIGDIFNIQTKTGYCATMNKPYFDFISSDWALNGRVNDLLNIKYIVTDKILDSSFIFKDSLHHLNLYERRNYYPRVYWKSQLGEPGSIIEEENKEVIKPLHYSDLSMDIIVDCKAPDTLILSENYYPGWTCFDNGRRIDIIPASIPHLPPIFRSVALDRGYHLLEFKYKKVFYWF